MKTIEINKDNAIKAYNATDSNGKKLLTNLLGTSVFEKLNIMDRVKTFDDAYEIVKDLNIKEAIDIIQEYEALKNVLTPDSPTLNWVMIRIIILALNEGWLPDWDKSSEWKHYPYFDMRGVGFSFSASGNAYSTTAVGSRLVLKSEDRAKYIATQFVEILKKVFVIPA